MGGDAVLGWVRLGLPVIATLARPLCHTGRIRDGAPHSDSPLKVPSPRHPLLPLQDDESSRADCGLKLIGAATVNARRFRPRRHGARPAHAWGEDSYRRGRGGVGAFALHKVDGDSVRVECRKLPAIRLAVEQPVYRALHPRWQLFARGLSQ